jgi:hypothetical protein
MDPVIWAALIAGGVSAIGNTTTYFVARFGRDAQREQMETGARVELAKINTDTERVRDERREAARRERRELYVRALALIGRLQSYGKDEPAPADEQVEKAIREFERLVAEMALAGALPVYDEMTNVLGALGRVQAQIDRFEGGPAAQFRAAYMEKDSGLPFEHRGDVVAAAKGPLVRAMRDDVTVPHLPE